MGIEDIQISEELETNAPSIKYSGDEGPKSPQQMQEMMMVQLEEEYLKNALTLNFLFNSSSTSWDPIKPPAPVTKIFFILQF